MKADDLRTAALEAYDRSNGSATMSDVQWLLKVRRLLTESAAEIERLRELGRVAGCQTDPAWSQRLVREGVAGIYPMVSGEQYEKDRTR